MFYVLVFGISFAGAFVSIVGGGASLLVVPVLVILGVPIHAVVATNRVYVTVFLLAGLLNYLRKKVRLDFRVLSAFLALRMVGGFVGSSLVLSLDESFLKSLAGAVILAAAVAVALVELLPPFKRLGRPSRRRFAVVALGMLMLGIYAGFVGGGVAVFARVLLVLAFGFTFLEAAAAEAVLGLGEGLAASAVFLAAGAVDFVLLLPMAAGGILGAVAGSSMAVRKGDGWIRRVVVLLVVVLVAKMLFF